jgi:hypothetical protein
VHVVTLSLTPPSTTVLQSTAVEPELLPESVPELEPPESVPPEELLDDEELVEDPLELVDPPLEVEPPELLVAPLEPELEASSPVPEVDGLLLLPQPPMDVATARALPARIVAIKAALIVVSSFRIAALRALSRPAAPKVLMIFDYLFRHGG